MMMPAPAGNLQARCLARPGGPSIAPKLVAVYLSWVRDQEDVLLILIPRAASGAYAGFLPYIHLMQEAGNDWLI